MTKKKAASILGTMLYKHECNSAFIDFDEDKEEALEWKEKKEALEMAIQCLKER